MDQEPSSSKPQVATVKDFIEGYLAQNVKLMEVLLELFKRLEAHDQTINELLKRTDSTEEFVNGIKRLRS